MEERLPVPADLTVDRVLAAGDEHIAAAGTVGGRRAVVIVRPPRVPESCADVQAVLTDGEETFRNDKWSKHNCGRAPFRVELIAPATDVDVAKYTTQQISLIRETPVLYSVATKPYIEAQPAKQVTWVYNILDGLSEQENVLHRTDTFVIVKDYKWDADAGPEKMHLLGFPTDRSLRSIRDLRAAHASMLRALLNAGLHELRTRFGLHAPDVRSYFHYFPSFWHLHVHFDFVSAPAEGRDVDRAHLVEDVLDALARDPEYFANANLSVAARHVSHADFLSRLPAGTLPERSEHKRKIEST